MLQEVVTHLQEVRSDSGKVGWNNLPFSERDETNGNYNAKALWACNCLKADYEKEGLGIQSGRVVEGRMAPWQDSCWCMNVCTMVALLSPSCPDNTQSMALREVGGRHLVNEEQMDLIGHALYLLFSLQLPPSLSDFSILCCSWALPSPSFQMGQNVCVLPIKSNEMLWSEPSAIPANAVRKWLNCRMLHSLGPLYVVLVPMPPYHSSP